MKLDRNKGDSGRGKYGLIRVRRLAQIEAWDGGEGEALDRQAVIDAIDLLERAGVIDWGTTPDTEFFVMRLRDENAGAGLRGYAARAAESDREYADEVRALARRAGENHPNSKAPD